MPPANQPSYSAAVAALIAANVIWGAAPPIFKLALTNIPPFSLAFLRFGLATLLLLPFLYRIQYWRVKKSDWFLLLQNAFYGITANISFFFLGLNLAPSINAGVIASASSIFTSLLAMAFLRERPGRQTFFGNLVGLAGVLLIVGSPLINHEIKTDLTVVTGNIFFILATLAAAAQAVTTRQLALRYRSRTFTFYSFLLGSLSFLPLALTELTNDPLWPTRLDPRGGLGIIFGTLFSSFLAYSLWGFAAEKITAAEIGLFMYLNPIVSILIAVPLLGEKITLPFILGSALALAGIYVAEKRVPVWPIHHHKRN